MDRLTTLLSRRRRWFAGLGLALCLARSVAAQDALPVGLFNDELPAIFPALLAQPTDGAGGRQQPNQQGPTQNNPADPITGLNIAGNTPIREPVASFAPEVTSLTLSPSTVGKTPAAVYVIDQEMIRRSGAQTLPEVLRMVPGVDVAIGNVGEPNVSIRGLGSLTFFPYSGRVLVLIDGRSIYDPVVGGVLWSPNDVILQDIERIEVIRGPGATVWGANAVNGVINVITKSAADTQGTLLQALGGTELKTITTARVGTQTGQDSYMRIFGKFRDIDDGSAVAGAPAANDGLRDFRGGFRWDYDDKDADKVTFQGNMFNAPRASNSYFPGFPKILATQPAYEYFGGNAQAKWTHSFDNDTQLQLMGIYDRLNYANSSIEFGRDSYIIDAAYSGSWGDRHKWLVGGQVRTDADAVTPLYYPSATTSLDPWAKTYTVTSWLVQDEIQLIPDSLSFLAGTKMEVNAFTGFEIQPSGRLLATIDDRRVTWVAVSRAIRRPSRIDDGTDVTLWLVPAEANPSPQIKSDALVAYEAGYRAQPIEWFSWDVTTYFNVYDHLPILYLGLNPPPDIPEFYQTNQRHAETTGAELSGTLTLTEQWKMTASYAYQSIWVHNEIERSVARPDVLSETGVERGYPNNIFYLRNSWSPTKLWDVDLIFRNVSSRQALDVPGYCEADLRVAWRPKPGLELALMGVNLLDSAHPELKEVPLRLLNAPFIRQPTEVERSVYASVTYSY